MNSICINGKFVKEDEPVLIVSNRGYRYGDGLFETMRVLNGRILLESYHFDRLFAGLELLRFSLPQHFSVKLLTAKILELCEKNKCTSLARVRLSISRGNGGLYDGDNRITYIIECWPLSNTVNEINSNGLIVGTFPVARKSCDKFSEIKSASCLPYVMAAQFAKENKWNDCILLNTEEKIADTTIANVFLIKDGVISTPAAGQGCIMGVMRRHLLNVLPQAGYGINEAAISVSDLLQADEVFLTNAVRGVQWVQQFETKTYSSIVTAEIYSRFVKTIFY